MLLMIIVLACFALLLAVLTIMGHFSKTRRDLLFLDQLANNDRQLTFSASLTESTPLSEVKEDRFYVTFHDLHLRIEISAQYSGLITIDVLNQDIPTWFSISTSHKKDHVTLTVGEYGWSFNANSSLPEYPNVTNLLAFLNCVDRDWYNLLGLDSQRFYCKTDLTTANRREWLDFIELFAQMATKLLLEIPESAESFWFKVLAPQDKVLASQDKVLASQDNGHPLVQLAIGALIKDHMDDPRVITSLKKAMSQLPAPMLLEIFSQNEEVLNALEPSDLSTDQKLLLIALTHKNYVFETYHDYFVKNGPEKLTPDDIDNLTREHMNARHHILTLCRGDEASLASLESNALTWLKWMSLEDAMKWIIALHPFVSGDHYPSLFEYLIDKDEHDITPVLAEAVTFFIILITGDPTLLAQPDWAKISTKMLPYHAFEEATTLIQQMETFAHPCVYPILSKMTHGYKYARRALVSLPELKSRFDTFNATGGITLALTDENAGALSLSQKPGQLSSSDEELP